MFAGYLNFTLNDSFFQLSCKLSKKIFFDLKFVDNYLIEFSFRDILYHFFFELINSSVRIARIYLDPYHQVRVEKLPKEATKKHQNIFMANKSAQKAMLYTPLMYKQLHPGTGKFYKDHYEQLRQRSIRIGISQPKLSDQHTNNPLLTAGNSCHAIIT